MSAKYDDSIKLKDKKGVLMVAHRGLSGVETENTLPAFEAAGKKSYYGIETDVHVTADGVFAIIHNSTTDYVTGGAFCMNVEQSTWAELRKAVLVDKSGKNAEPIRIPRLTDYVRSCANNGKYCVLELKNPFAEKDIKRLVGEIGGTGWLDRIIFISFDMKNCLVLRSLLPAARIQFLTSSPVTPELIQTLKEKRFGIDIKHDLLTAELAALLRANGIVINCWTVDDPERAEELIKMGVDQITSNILE